MNFNITNTNTTDIKHKRLSLDYTKPRPTRNKVIIFQTK